jgi:hypothetical protein
MSDLPTAIHERLKRNDRYFLAFIAALKIQKGPGSIISCKKVSRGGTPFHGMGRLQAAHSTTAPLKPFKTAPI